MIDEAGHGGAFRSAITLCHRSPAMSSRYQLFGATRGRFFLNWSACNQLRNLAGWNSNHANEPRKKLDDYLLLTTLNKGPVNQMSLTD